MRTLELRILIQNSKYHQHEMFNEFDIPVVVFLSDLASFLATYNTAILPVHTYPCMHVLSVYTTCIASAS